MQRRATLRHKDVGNYGDLPFRRPSALNDTTLPGRDKNKFPIDLEDRPAILSFLRVGRDDALEMEPLSRCLRTVGMLPSERWPKLFGRIPLSHIPFYAISGFTSTVEALGLYNRPPPNEFLLAVLLLSLCLKPLSYFYSLYHFCRNYDKAMAILSSVGAKPSRRYAIILTAQAFATFVISTSTALFQAGTVFEIASAVTVSILWSTWMMVFSCSTVIFSAIGQLTAAFPTSVRELASACRNAERRLTVDDVRRLGATYTGICGALQSLGNMHAHIILVWYADTVLNLLNTFPGMVARNAISFFEAGVSLTLVLQLTAAISNAAGHRDASLCSVHELAIVENGKDPTMTRELLVTCTAVRVSDVHITAAGFFHITSGFVITLFSGVITFLAIAYPS